MLSSCSPRRVQCITWRSEILRKVFSAPEPARNGQSFRTATLKYGIHTRRDQDRSSTTLKCHDAQKLERGDNELRQDLRNEIGNTRHVAGADDSAKQQAARGRWKPYTEAGNSNLKNLASSLKNMKLKVKGKQKNAEVSDPEIQMRGYTSLPMKVRPYNSYNSCQDEKNAAVNVTEPISNPLWSPLEDRLAQKRKVKRKPNRDELKSLRQNPWARLLAGDIRMCQGSRIRIPTGLMVDFTMVEHPSNGQTYLAPHALASLDDLKKSMQRKRDRSLASQSQQDLHGNLIRILPYELLMTVLTEQIEPGGQKRSGAVEKTLLPQRWKQSEQVHEAFEKTKHNSSSKDRKGSERGVENHIPDLSRLQWQSYISSRLLNIMRQRILIALDGVARGNQSLDRRNVRHVSCLRTAKSRIFVSHTGTLIERRQRKNSYDEPAVTQEDNAADLASDSELHNDWISGSFLLHIGDSSEYLNYVNRHLQIDIQHSIDSPDSDEQFLPPMIMVDEKYRLPLFHLESLLGPELQILLAKLLQKHKILNLQYWNEFSSSVLKSHSNMDRDETSAEPYFILVKSTATGSHILGHELWRLWRYIGGMDGMGKLVNNSITNVDQSSGDETAFCGTLSIFWKYEQDKCLRLDGFGSTIAEPNLPVGNRIERDPVAKSRTLVEAGCDNTTARIHETSFLSNSGVTPDNLLLETIPFEGFQVRSQWVVPLIRTYMSRSSSFAPKLTVLTPLPDDDKCLSVQCIYCQQIRAKNTSRQKQHLLECPGLQNHPSAQQRPQSSSDNGISSSSGYGPSTTLNNTNVTTANPPLQNGITPHSTPMQTIVNRPALPSATPTAHSSTPVPRTAPKPKTPKTTPSTSIPAPPLDDVHAAFVEFRAKEEDKCLSVQCIYCQQIRAKNTSRQRQHLLECPTYLNVMKDSIPANNLLHRFDEGDIARSLALPTPTLELDFRMSIKLNPRVSVGPATYGQRNWLSYVGGQWAGRWGKGIVIPGGQDSQLVVKDLATRINANYLIQTNDDPPALIIAKTSGWWTGPKEVMEKMQDPLQADTVPANQYKFRVSLDLETGDDRYLFLNTTMWIGSGSRRAHEIIYDAYRVG